MTTEEMKKIALSEISARENLAKNATTYETAKMWCDELCAVAGVMEKMELLSPKIYGSTVERAVGIIKGKSAEERNRKEKNMTRHDKVEIVIDEINEVSLIPSYMERYYRRAINKALIAIEERESTLKQEERK